MQIILQATHGIVSGAPDFFRTAFGDTFDEFHEIILRPHHYIFNRYWYEQFDGRAELESYQSDLRKLDDSEKYELLEFLCGRDGTEYEGDLHQLSSSGLRDVGQHYIPMLKQEEAKIWEAQRARRVENLDAYLVADDERVEDAVLTDDDIQPAAHVPETDKNQIRAVA